MTNAAPNSVAKTNDQLVLKGKNSGLYSKARLITNAKKTTKRETNKCLWNQFF